MGDQHLSELCRGSELEPIRLRLKQVADNDTEDVNEESSAAVRYISGIWGYRDADGRTAFHWAVSLKNFDLARKLMAPPCNSPVLTEDNDSVTPFETACTVGAPEDFVTELLDKSVAAYNVFRMCPTLQNSSKVETKPAAAAPVPTSTIVDPPASGTPADAATADTATAATPSAPKDSVINHADELGNTALIQAVSRGHTRLVRILLQRGANLNHQNARGQSALHRAVSRGDQDLIEELVRTSEKLNAGSRVAHQRWMNLQDFRGDSALFYASMENNEEVGRYLLRHGADRELRNKEGKQFWEV